MSIPAADAVIFDFNGTMMYDSPIHEGVWKDFLPAHGVDIGSPEEYAKHIFGCSNRYILTHYLGNIGEEEIARLTYEKEAEYRRRCLLDDDAFRLVDGLCDFLDALKAAGIPVTIATGSEINNVNFYFSSPKLGLDRWFDRDKVVYDDDSFPGKPAPDVYLRAAEAIGVPMSRCAVFEDSFSGVRAARSAGAAFVAVLGRGVRKEAFDAAGGADYAMEDFTGWREVFRRITGRPAALEAFCAETSDDAIARLLKTAGDEVGYMEKSRLAWESDPSCLDDKTAGAGFDNYTKYGRDMHALQPSNMDFPAYWCASFVDWCFLQAFGEETARALLGDFDDYTPNAAALFQNRSFWSGPEEKPSAGDLVFFRNNQRICHVGIVVEVSGEEMKTIEGNTSETDETGNQINGGTVAYKMYALSDTRIAGYGKPPYGVFNR